MPYLKKIWRSSDIPIVLVNDDLSTIKGLDNLELTGYTSGNTDTGTTGTPDSNGYIWTLPNGQPFPPIGILLFSNHRRTYYYEDKDLTTKFQVIGKTIEQCSRVSNDQVGVFTGGRQFNSTNSFGKGYTLKSLEVKTKFPFDRLGNPVETEYTLWVDTFVKYFEDNVVKITANEDGTLTYTYADGSTKLFTQEGKPLSGTGTTGTTGGYTTGDGDKPTATATKNRNAFLIIGGILLLILTRKSKRK